MKQSKPAEQQPEESEVKLSVEYEHPVSTAILIELINVDLAYTIHENPELKFDTLSILFDEERNIDTVKAHFKLR